jgi:hypothetical protein
VGERLSRPDALAGGPQPGDRAPDVPGLRRNGVEFPVRLFDLFRGPHHTLLLYGTAPAGLLEAIRGRCGSHVRVYQIIAPEAAGPAAETCPTLVDAGGNFRRVYAAAESTAYLIRPDGYVGFRTDSLRPDSLDEYLERIFRP